jgi:hypothetical protein
MQSYEVTSVGKQIAHDSGLERLPEHILKVDLHNPLLVELTEDYPYLFESYEEIETDAVQMGRKRLKSDHERLIFERGLQINSDQDSWRQIGGLAEDTLFPSPTIDRFMPARDEDRFVLSGIVGLSLVDFRQRCHLLARTRFEEYGFKSFNESCAFVGAYVVSALGAIDRARIYERTPFFTYVERGVSRKILIGGTINGDFRMSESTLLTSGIISPINTETEFSPVNITGVSAYHSVEPSIVEAMLLQEVLKGDRQRLTGLVDEFIDGYNDLYQSLSEQAREAANNPFNTGFADYGMRDDVDDTVFKIKMLLEDKLRRNSDTFYESIIYPGSRDITFEIVSLDNGIRLQNIGYYDNNNNDITPFIDIDRQYFGDLFKTLLLQAQAALGRTSPQQLIKLIFAVKGLLNN